jgi:NAD/NADP transhydrogenase beta subunit
VGKAVAIEGLIRGLRIVATLDSASMCRAVAMCNSCNGVAAPSVALVE